MSIADPKTLFDLSAFRVTSTLSPDERPWNEEPVRIYTTVKLVTKRTGASRLDANCVLSCMRAYACIAQGDVKAALLFTLFVVSDWWGGPMNGTI